MRAFNKSLGATGLALILVAGLAAPALAQDGATDIDFGDDTSEWANDGECDDPRFAGEGMAAELESVDIAHDATDCRTLYEAGSITLAPPDEGDAAATEPVTSPAGDIDFGDDTSEWANDQECDDPRFAGSGMARELDEENIARDATDCRIAYEDGTITLAEDGPDQPPATPPAGSVLEALAGRIDFGDDSGAWPNDGECDDPDFAGTGAASDPSDTARLRDAT